MRVAVSGSRFKFFRRGGVGAWLVHGLLARVLVELGASEVGVGGNPASVDSVAALAASELGVPVRVFTPATWRDRGALLERSRRMVEWCDALVAVFVDRVTPGTLHAARYALALGKPIRAYLVDTVGRSVETVPPARLKRLG